MDEGRASARSFVLHEVEREIAGFYPETPSIGYWRGYRAELKRIRALLAKEK